MNSPTQKFIANANIWMKAASEIAMRHYNAFDASSEIISKADNSPLTQADLQVDAYLGKVLKETFPDIPVVTEERASSHDLDVSKGYFFLVDPIDGTKEFINKRDEFTVNIALLKDCKPIAGVVCAPALNRSFLGVVSEGASETNLISGEVKKISVSTPDNSALMVVASRSHLSPETKSFIDANPVADMKSAGSSLKFCLIAGGEADLYPRFGPTMEWDTAAGHAVLLAAGGFVDNLDGTPLVYAKQEFRNPWFIAGAKGVVSKM
ncbi:MAG: 3'(2'),5'-bisphosphate nucleotidase CysQ [Salaquimonas sp.]